MFKQQAAEDRFQKREDGKETAFICLHYELQINCVMKQNPSWITYVLGQKFPLTLWDPDFVTIFIGAQSRLRQLTSFLHKVTFYFCKLLLSIILLSMPKWSRYFRFTTIKYKICISLHACNMTRPSNYL